MAGDVNPWSDKDWNVTAQGQYEKEKGVARAEARARDAGTIRGGKRPSGGNGGGGSSDGENHKAFPGPRGHKGDKGDKGDPGTPGSGDGSASMQPPGRDGDDGEPGVPGLKGDKGDKGDTGDSATSSVLPPPGADGVDGDAGPPGIGTPGTAGIDGVPGGTGPPGRDGEDDNTEWLFPNGAACSALPFNDPNFFWNPTKPQLGIGTSAPNASAILDLSSTTLGFLAPRMTTTQRNAISSPAEGLQIYNTTTGDLNVYNGTTWIAFNPDTVSVSASRIGLPGNFNQGSTTQPVTFSGQRMWYYPFPVRRKISITDVLFRVGATAASSPTYFIGIYAWDYSTNKPTTLLGSVSQAVLINTGYSKSLALSLAPGMYALAILSDQVGTQIFRSGVWGQDGYGQDNSDISAADSVLTPLIYAGALTNVTTLPNPNAETLTGFGSWTAGALTSNGNWRLPATLRWTEP